MNESQQAELLARWIAGEIEGPPEGLDPEVVESIFALKPELAPPPRLSVEEVLAAVKVGPLAGSENPMPVNASLGVRPWWIAIAGVGGLSSLAAIGLVVVGLGLGLSRSGGMGGAPGEREQTRDAVVDSMPQEEASDRNEGALDLDERRKTERSDKGSAPGQPGLAPDPPPAKAPVARPAPAPEPAPRPAPVAAPTPDSRDYGGAAPRQAAENEASSSFRMDPVSLRAAARLGAGPQSQVVRDAQAALSRGDHIQALALCGSGLASSPDTGTRQWLLALQGDAHEAAGDNAAAEQSWRAAVEVSSSLNPQ